MSKSSDMKSRLRIVALWALLGAVLASPPASAREVALSSRGPNTVRELLAHLDARLTEPLLSGFTRLGVGGGTTDGSAEAGPSPAAAQVRNYFFSGTLNPGDVDGDGGEDVMFYGLDHESMLLIRVFRGSDGQALWSMQEPLYPGMALYVDFGDFDAAAGSDIVLLKTEYVLGESHSGLLDAQRQDTLVQRLSVRHGADGSVAWEQDRDAAITSRYVSPLESLPWDDYVIEEKGVIDVIQPVGNVAGGACDDLFLSTVDSRWTERSVAFWLLPRYFSSGRVAASIVDGCFGETAASVDRTSEHGVPLAYPVGDVSGDGVMDIATGSPAAGEKVVLEAHSLGGALLWSASVGGHSLRAFGVPLVAAAPNDVIVVSETVTDAETGTSTFSTHGRRGTDGGALWSLDRELRPHRLGDVDGDGSQELLLTDSVDPAAATMISAVTGTTLAPVWGPVSLSKEVEGARVESECVCPAHADFDGDGIDDLGIRRMTSYQGWSEGEFSAVSGRNGSELWVHQTRNNTARPVPTRTDLNANGTTDVWSFEHDASYHGTAFFHEGASLSPLWGLPLSESWSYTEALGVDLSAEAGSEVVLYHVPVMEGTVETLAAYVGTTLLWQVPASGAS